MHTRKATTHQVMQGLPQLLHDQPVLTALIIALRLTSLLMAVS